MLVKCSVSVLVSENDSTKVVEVLCGGIQVSIKRAVFLTPKRAVFSTPFGDSSKGLAAPPHLKRRETNLG